jgi:hypothetical protein
MLHPAVRMTLECMFNAEYNLIGTLITSEILDVPSSTAREARRPAIEDEKAWRESCARSSGLNLFPQCIERTNVDLISASTSSAIRVY